jgi:hypothetical protein
MNFADSMQAKEFLISRIAAEARRRHIGLSDLERQMMYFSETSPTLPDMIEIAERFQAEYSDEKYEKKVKGLSRKAFERDRKEGPENTQLWREAVRVLKKEDHYILVMLDIPRSATDLPKLVGAGLLATAALVGSIATIDWAGKHIHIRVPGYVEALAVILAFVAAYFVAFSKTGTKLGDGFGELVVRVIRWF